MDSAQIYKDVSRTKEITISSKIGLSETAWTIEERRARADLIEVYKIIHGIS